MPEPEIESREAQAMREAGNTEIRPALARTVTGVFVVLLVTVAALEIGRDLRHRAASPWPALIDAPRLAGRTLGPSGLFAANRQLHAAMEDFEDALTERSVVGKAARADIQWLLTAKLNTGNEQVVRGRKGWLYFRPAVDHLTGPGFLEPRVLARKGTKTARDPLLAIQHFAAQLAERGIGLVVVPTPVKAAIHPEGLAAVGDDDPPLENLSSTDFLVRLRELEIPAYSPTERLRQLRREKPGALFLRTDTHWTPQAMEATAEGLAGHIARHVALPDGHGATYSRGESWVRGRGDLAALLRLPQRRALFGEELIRGQPVFDADGQPWVADPEADILLMGDSFTNIYSQAELDFGAGAGFAEQLSYYLGRKVDKLALNAGGPTPVRRRLVEDLAAGNDRLAGKRLVVWQFSERELSSGDWSLVDLAAPRSGGSRLRRPEDPLRARGLAVWESNRTGAWRIWSRRLEGSVARQLSPDEPGREHCCAHLSPDGSQVAYLSRVVPADQYPEREVAGELRVMKFDGSGERSLSPEARPYGWGNRAVVWRDDRELIHVGGDGLTYLLDTVTGAASALTREPQGMLAWLMDPSLSHAVNGSPTFSSFDRTSSTVDAGERNSGCEPYFSHDGRFGFWVERAAGPVRSIEFATGRVGSILENLDPRIPGAQRYVYFPMLSPDGRMLAFGASAGDHDHFKSNYDIFVAPTNPATLALLGRPQRLTAHPAVDRYPDVHVESLDAEGWAKELPPVALIDASAPPPPPPAGPVEAQATLRSCSRVPSLREISPYRAALIVCEWQVDELISGRADDGLLRVAHWALRDGERQPMANHRPGFTTRLSLAPLKGAAQTEGYPIFDTLPRAPRPVHYADKP
jgi:alginate O-acetyltransferase complex protein AlgJ